MAGWNEHEFAMFGKDLREHDERYVYAQEWATIAKRIWSEDDAVRFHAANISTCTMCAASRSPIGGGRPLLMSAGSSPAGRRFAAEHADCLFMVIHDVDRLAQDIADAPRACRTAMSACTPQAI